MPDDATAVSGAADPEREREIAAYRETIDELSAELAETNRGVVALSLELEGYRDHLEELVAERTRQLESTQEELQQTNSELLMLTSELDTRIAVRTAELTEANAELTHQIDEVDLARGLVRRINDRLELATQAAGLGIWEWDVEADELVWDATTYRLYGEDESAGRPPAGSRRERLDPQAAERVALSAGSPLLAHPRFATEFEVLWPDGSRHVIASTGLVVRDGDGTPVTVVGIDQDVTERVAAAEELARYQGQLEDLVAERTAQWQEATARANEANVAKSAFLANMSHELRTPMNAILGFADLLRTGDPTPAQRQEYLDIISRSGTHLLALINDILDMSKIESGRIELDVAPVAVRALLTDVAALLGDRAAQKGLGLDSDIAEDVPEVILADEVKVRQILLNLLSNAVKSTESGRVVLRARRRTADDGSGPLLLLEVEDSGVGIDAADLDRIFEPFQQVGASAGGTGLGLSISRRFAELMGGALTVESRPGAGSVFRVALPGDESDLVPARTGAARRRVVGLEPGQSVRVLIVEDQKESALLLRTLMEKAGIDAVVAEDGRAGVAAFVAERPDLIWMDRRMPVMDGLEATRLIRALEGGADVVIIGVTASVFADERSTLVGAGMDAVVTKPYQAHEIFACLEERLGVRFRYDVDEPGPAVPALQVSAQQLALLPSEVRAALEDALVLLDVRRIDAAIALTAEVDPDVAGILRAQSEAMRYEEILAALDGVREAGDGP